MKAYAYVDRISLDNLQEIECPDPEPGEFDVVIRTKAVALNFRDLAIARGHYHIQVKPPLVPISDGAGEVVTVGSKVTRVQIGDLVCPVYLPDWVDGPVRPEVVRCRLGGPNDGVLSEYFCANEEAVVKMPGHLSPEEAATLPVAAVTAWQSIYQLGSLRPGETITILGCGGVSTAAIQLARAGGARVIAVTRRGRHMAQLREIGAHEVLTTENLAQWPERVLKLTGGRGADVVVDVVGGDSLACSISAIRPGGCVHLVGYAADTAATIDIFDAIRHAATIRVAAAGNRASFEAVIRAIDQNKLRPAVDRRFEVTQFREAFQHLSQGGHFGKVVLTF